MSDFYSFYGITVEIADQVQNWKLLKAFHSHLCSVQVTSVCLVAGYLTLLAPEARPKLHENLNRLLYKERRHGRVWWPFVYLTQEQAACLQIKDFVFTSPFVKCDKSIKNVLIRKYIKYIF